jgi:hypothetical protein
VGDYVAAFGYNSIDDGAKVWQNIPSEISEDILKRRWRPTTSEFLEILHFNRRTIAPGEVLKLDTRDDQVQCHIQLLNNLAYLYSCLQMFHAHFGGGPQEDLFYFLHHKTFVLLVVVRELHHTLINSGSCWDKY